ncbi:MAG: pilus assembly protein [Sphingomonas sp.]|nr:pilus assembly protein [Sphingomonas sp.]
MFARLLRQETGSAAAEMALVAPLLMIIMFGSMELGNYFFSEHVVAKAVRDGARVASRRGFGDYTCPNTIGGTVVNDTQNVTRTNTLDGSGVPRLRGWTQNSSVTVTLRCDTSGTYVSFYEGLGGVPVVSVSAVVPYTSLFQVIGFNSIGLTVRSASEVPVMGV